MELLRDADIDPSPLAGKRVAVLGYGNQGRAQALNLHDSGIDVVVGLRSGSGSTIEAESAGLATALVEEAVSSADVVMMLRIQHERMQGHFIPSVREYFALFGMTPERLRRAQPDMILMHPGPMNRGVEIDSEVADGPYSVILEQVANGVAVRMAVLYLLAGRDTDLSEVP